MTKTVTLTLDSADAAYVATCLISKAQTLEKAARAYRAAGRDTDADFTRARVGACVRTHNAIKGALTRPQEA